MTTTPTERRTRTDAPSSLDELVDASPRELAALYAAAFVPSLGALRGDLRGRMLASPLAPRRARAVLRALARSRRFPWRGKSFRPPADDATRGEGVNRVLSDRLKLFRFATSVGRSRAGDFDALRLDYDRPGNPWFIRHVQDELRALRDGLYLGQAWVTLGATPRLVVWFGLEG